MIEKFSITRFTEGKTSITEDFLVQEIAFTININGRELATLLCSPADLKELAKGFLFSSGIIKHPHEIKNIYLDTQKWLADIELTNAPDYNLISKRLYTSGCGKGTLFYSAIDLIYKTKIVSDLKIKASFVLSVMTDFYKKSEIFLKTGGTHAAAIADDKSIKIFKEDIGRHNAIDKVIGQALSENIVFGDKFLITSGRITSEVIFKCRKSNISIVVSKGAPTNQAVKHARNIDLTLVGFARGSKLNIYSAERRILQ